MSRLSGIDPFLFHVPDASPTKLVNTRGGGLFQSTSFKKVASEAIPADWLPALVHLPTANHTFEPHPEFRVASRLGNVLSGRGSKAALQAIGLRDGLSVEVSRDGGNWELDTSISTVNGHPVAAPGTADVERHCIVGIIDGGLDPFHDAFLDADGKTRILFVWDQTATTGKRPRAVDAAFEHEYGALHTADDINRAIESKVELPRFGASDNDRTHGTHVASIAAGRRSPSADGKSGFAGGMAPDAPIVFVIPALRAQEGQAPSEGFAKSHVDALKFIDTVAGLLKLPAVVNLSAGIAAGAHDGSSALEAGFDAFTKGGRAPGRAIVKSAGNARVERKYLRFELARGDVVDIDLRVPKSGRGAATVEVWFSSAHEIEVKLSEAKRTSSFTLSLREPSGKLDTSGGTAYLSYQRFHFDNGESQLLLTLPSTSSGFTLEFTGSTIRGLGDVDLWIEGTLELQEATRDRTLTTPGAAFTAITVASCDREGHTIAKTSSRGPTRDGRHKPEIFAPGINILAAKAATRSDTVEGSGTSMAAPHVTGAVALLFSKQKRLGRDLPNALQTRAALIATAARMDGNWQPHRGYGLLDARALLTAFDPAPGVDAAATPSASPLGDTVPQK